MAIACVRIIYVTAGTKNSLSDFQDDVGQFISAAWCTGKTEFTDRLISAQEP
jgi:hypothetical protein